MNNAKRKMSLQDAMDIVPDDLPDGAYFAMLHEVAGAEYGEVWDELDEYAPDNKIAKKAVMTVCAECGRRIKSAGLWMHMRDKHKAKP